MRQVNEAPQKQADKGPGLHHDLQGLDMFPMEGIHEEVWEEEHARENTRSGQKRLPLANSETI